MRFLPLRRTTTSARPHGVAGRLLAALAVIGALLFALPAVAAAQDDPANQFATIEVDPLGVIPGTQLSTVDALITISTDRAVAGTLVVVDEPQGAPSTTWEYEIDQAAGTSVEIPVVLTSTWDGISVGVSLTSNGETIATEAIRQFPNGGSEIDLVGTLGIADPPRFVNGPGDQPVTPFAIDAAPAAVSRLSTLVATPEAFTETLAGPTGSAALAWLRGGGQLVVTGPTRSLDDRFHAYPTASPDRFLVGAGSVLYDSDWTEGLGMGGYIGADSIRQNLEEQGFGYGAGGELSLLADLALPRASLVTGVLLGYALIAGPLLFLVLGRSQRQRRMWLVLPALAGLVAAGVLVVGLIDARGRGDAHITIVEVDDQGSRATSNLLVSSRGGGTREVVTPADWRFLGQNVSANQRSVRVRPDAAGLRVAMELPPAGSGNLRVTGPAPSYDGAIRIENIRRNADGGLTADVVNNSGADLEDAVGFLGNQRVDIGDIEAGTIRAFSIAAGENDRIMQELLIWPRVRQEWTGRGPIAVPRDRNADDPVEAGAWAAWRIDQGANAVPDHIIGVAGWTDELDSPVAGIGQGNTALFVRTEVPPELLGENWSTSAYRPNFNGSEPIFIDEFFGWPQDYRFTLGPGTTASEIALRVSREAAGLGVLIDGVWTYAELPDDNDLALLLPDEVADAGEIVVRALIPDWEWNAPRTVFVETELPADSQTVRWRADRPVFRFNNGFRGPDFPPPAAFPGSNQGVVVTQVNDIAPFADEPQVFENFLPQGEGATHVLVLTDGQTLTATMRSERDDSYLELWIGGEQVDSNDDFQGLDSRVEFTMIGGEEIVEVVAMGLGGQAIDYELTLEIN